MAENDPVPAASDAGRVPMWFWKACHLCAGVLLPGACIALSFGIGLAPSWQSGVLRELAGYLFWGPTAFAFFPLMLYSMLAMVLMLFCRERFAPFFPVRFGIYSGAVLAGLYAVKASIFLVIPIWLVFPVAALALRAAMLWMDRTKRWRNLWLVAPLSLWLVGDLGYAAVTGHAFVVSFVAIIGLLAAAPYLAFLSYLLMWLGMARDAKFAPASGGMKATAAAVWGSAYVGAWVVTVHRATEHYASLPTHDDCYIATAAARGHAGVVGSLRVRLAGGGEMAVNCQLRWLKLAEIALRAAIPRLHRACRGLYDTFGPALAREIRSPIMADLAYLALKPVEWAARAALVLLVPDAREIAARLYV